MAEQGKGGNGAINVEVGTPGLDVLRAVYFGGVGSVTLTAQARERVAASARTVAEIAGRDAAVYGVNTGFGLLAQTRIPADRLVELQENLVLSHAAGVGEGLPDPVVRLILLLKVISLSRGYSGVRQTVIDHLLAMLEKSLLPVIPAKGSVGASGDLAPLAHMTLAAMGQGEIRCNGQVQPAAAALKAAGLEPLTLGPKEGLALLNGTQASTALALAGLFQAENTFAAAVVAGALSVDALKGSKAPFDPRIHDARGQLGQMAVAGVYRTLLEGSDIIASHVNCDRVQDPYSLRCQPQVMGAALDVIAAASAVLRREAAGATDNPLIFAETGETISGGNFHAEPIAFAADMLALPLVEIAAMSERRIAILVDPKMSGLPAFLVENSGVNSGFMIAQVTAAALVSENKTMAHPSSVDSIPTSANQEDHVSMATYGARRLGDMAGNAANVVAVELLAAAQGHDFHLPLKTSAALQQVHGMLRDRVPHYDRDRYFAPDIAAVADLVQQGCFYPFVADILPSGANAQT